MIPRIVLGYLLALPAMGLIVLAGIDRSRPGVIVTMAASHPGVLQVFYDSGKGFNEPQSSAVHLQASEQSREYRLELPPAEYRSFRIDPGTAPGRYVIHRVAIRDGGALRDLVIPLEDVVPAHEIRIVARSSTQIVADSVGYDPVFIYAPRTPVTLASGDVTLAALLKYFAAWWIGMVILIWLLERGLERFTPAAVQALHCTRTWIVARPVQALSIVALLATIAATHPIWFFDRSFVSPNNGGGPMLYSEPPFVPGSSDFQREDTRGSDVWAAMLEFVPYSVIQRQALSQGEVPLWNRYNGAGRPLWGQGMTFLLDPLHWLTLVAPDPSVGWDLKFIAHRFVFALGVGFAAFATTRALVPSVIIAAGAPFLGVYAYWLSHPGTFALTYAPWALLAWFRLARAESSRTRARAVMLLAVTLSLVLVASPPKQAIATLIAIGIAGGLASVLVACDWRERVRSLAAAAAATLIMLLLTAPHWLIFLDTLRLSVTEYDVPHVWFANHPAAVALFLTPLNPGPVAPGFHLLALVLGVATVTAPRRLWNNRELLASLIASLTLLGAAFGLFPAAAIVQIPLIKNIVHVNDVFVAAGMPLFLISGAVGAGALLSAGRTRTTIVAGVTVAAGWWLVSSGRELSAPAAFQPWAVALLLVPAVGLPWCVASWQNQRTPFLSLAASAAACAALVLPGGLHLESGSRYLDALLIQPRYRVQLDLDSPAVETVHLASADPVRTTGFDTILMPGSQALYQLEGLGGADALEVPVYRELLDASGVRRSSWITWVDAADVDRLSPLMDMLNVGFFLARSESKVPGSTDLPVPRADRVRIGRRTTVWPRAFFVDRLTSYSDPAHFVGNAGHSSVPFAAVQSSGEANAGLAPSATTVVPADQYHLTANTTSFRVRSPKAGIAVLSETFMPNQFRVTLNGRPARYFRVNHAFKAVRIPSAGDWYVTFEYRPDRWDFSLGLAAIGVLCIAAVGVLGTRRAVAATTPANPGRRIA